MPLTQLKVVHANKVTRQAVDDWHYWVEMGYEF
ncbi:MAG: calcium-binding protein [Isosphaeraceae bacterium]